MELRMEQVKVSVSPERMIVIEQDDHGSEFNSIVVLHPDQVETVCEWMRKARDEAVAKQGLARGAPVERRQVKDGAARR